MKPISRRKLITTGVAAAAGLVGLTAAGRVAKRYGLIPPDGGVLYGAGETLTYAVQLVLAPHALAREFSRSMISKSPYSNTPAPPSDAFMRFQASGFSELLSLSDLKAFPMRSQITEVVCEEGWSYIAEWIGTPLDEVLKAVGVLPQARYIVYSSIEDRWWDSIDMGDALHPQTLLTWGMNDGDLPMSFGGPLRMRVPRQLGYQSVKYINHLTATDTLKSFGKGLGSAPPEGGYAWYAGI
jgi:hypothetical protein